MRTPKLAFAGACLLVSFGCVRDLRFGPIPSQSSRLRARASGPRGAARRGLDQIRRPDRQLFAKLAVVDATGNDLAASQPQVSADGLVLSVKLKPLPPGDYTVKWAVVCIDTHGPRVPIRFPSPRAIRDSRSRPARLAYNACSDGYFWHRLIPPDAAGCRGQRRLAPVADSLLPLWRILSVATVVVSPLALVNITAEMATVSWRAALPLSGGPYRDPCRPGLAMRFTCRVSAPARRLCPRASNRQDRSAFRPRRGAALPSRDAESRD